MPFTAREATRTPFRRKNKRDLKRRCRQRQDKQRDSGRGVEKFDDIISRYEKQRNLTMERYMEITARYDSIYEKFKAFDA